MTYSNHNQYFFSVLFIVSVLLVMHALIYFTFFYRNYFFNLALQKGGLYLTISLLFLSLFFIFAHFRIHLPYFVDMAVSLGIGIGFLLSLGAVFYYFLVFWPFLFMSKEKLLELIPLLKAGALFISFLAILFSIYQGMFAPIVVRTFELGVKKLSKPLKILQITDLHIHPLTSEARIRQIIKKANSLKPDVIALTGDIVDYDVNLVAQKVDLLKGLKAKSGVYFVLGNHELMHNPDRILEELKSLGIVFLNNSSYAIKRSGAPFVNIIGVNDFSAKSNTKYAPDLKRAIFSGYEDIPNVLLSHQPKVINQLKELPDSKFHVDLVLSGHTHGGQIFPFNFLVPLQQPLVKGLHEFKNGEFIYVSQGSGTWGPPMRFGTTSEISVFNLTPEK